VIQSLLLVVEVATVDFATVTQIVEEAALMMDVTKN
jgi:hypothetical protein